jgi:hypothetical protein
MSGSNRSVAELADIVEVRAPVYLRLAPLRGAEEWELRMFELTVGEAPPSWQPGRVELRERFVCRSRTWRIDRRRLAPR